LNILDRIVSLVSPEKGLRREMARNALQSERAYGAARRTGTWAGWTPVGGTVNDEIRDSSTLVRARVRQLVRDFPPFHRAVQILESYIAGPNGPVVQSHAPAQTAEIEEAWKRWGESCDISGRMSWPDLFQLSVRQACECGEWIFIFRPTKDGLRLQPVEPDRISNLVSGQNIEQGVEFDPQTGGPLYYHIDQGEFNVRPVRVPATQVLHGFHSLRPGQLRGISPFAAGVLLADSLRGYVQSETEAARMASRYLAFIQTPDIAGFQQTHGAEYDTSGQKMTDTLDELVMEYLRPGESVNIASHNRPGENFSDFTKFVLKMLSVTTGVPYELLSGDYSGINYSTMRVSRNDLAAVLRPIQSRFVRQLAMPVWRRWMDGEVEARRLSLPRYLLEKDVWQACRWTSPGLESIDPLKESKAWEQMLKLNLVSPQELAAQRGRALEDLYEENAEAREMRKKLNLLEPEQAKVVSSKTNPAAITEEDENA